MEDKKKRKPKPRDGDLPKTSDFANYVYKNSHLNKKDAQEFTSLFVKMLEGFLATNKGLYLRGLGTFFRKRKTYNARDIIRNQKLDKVEKDLIYFNMGLGLKKKIKLWKNKNEIY